MALAGLFDLCEEDARLLGLHYYIAIASIVALDDKSALAGTHRPEGPALDAVITAVAEEAGRLSVPGMSKSCGYSGFRIRLVVNLGYSIPGNAHTSLEGQ